MVGKTILDNKIVQFQKPTYSFGVISDIHINRTSQDAEGDLRKAFSAFRNRGITRVFCCGDISTNHTEDELALFKAVKDEYPEITFRSCTGNHDVQFTEQQWQAYIGHGFINGLNQCMYVEEINGDVFCLLPIKSWEDAHPYSSGDDLQAFYNNFRTDLGIDGKRIFLFMHFPLNSDSGSMQYPGLKIGQHYGFGSGSEDNFTIKQAVADSVARGYCRNVTVFSGHSHYAFDVADKAFKARYLKFEMSNYGEDHTQFSKLELLNKSNISFSFPSDTSWTCSITPVSNQTPAQAIDGNLNTKFCAPSYSNQFNIVYDLKSACLDLMEFSMFRLFSGSDNSDFPNRSVRNMKISVKANESDEWIEVLDAVDIPKCNVNCALEYESYVDGQAVNQHLESDPNFKDAIFLQEGSFAHVHVPSLVVPRDQNMNVIHSGHPDQQPAQGYVVDVYPDYVKLAGLEFNLKLFDADQRKGLVRIDNRYVAKCNKKESNIINYLGIYFKEAVNLYESYFEIGRLQLKDSQLNDIDIYTGSQYIGFAVDNSNTYYDTPGNGCYYRNHEVEMPQNMCMMNNDSIVIGYASNPANKKFPFLSPYKLEIPLNLNNTIYYTQRCGRNGSLSTRKVKSFSLMGSKDGINWFSLYDYNQTPPTQDCVPFFTNELISPSQTQIDLSMFIKTNA